MSPGDEDVPPGGKDLPNDKDLPGEDVAFVVVYAPDGRCTHWQAVNVPAIKIWPREVLAAFAKRFSRKMTAEQIQAILAPDLVRRERKRRAQNRANARRRRKPEKARKAILDKAHQLQDAHPEWGPYTVAARLKKTMPEAADINAKTIARWLGAQ